MRAQINLAEKHIYYKVCGGLERREGRKEGGREKEGDIRMK